MNNMEYPILIYDDRCGSCTQFAKFTNFILRGKITMIGHYSPQGVKLKQAIFPENYDGTDMSWFLTKKKAYGGRRVLALLFRYMFSRKHGQYPANRFDETECSNDCNSVKGVMLRSCSILSNSKIIEY